MVDVSNYDFTYITDKKNELEKSFIRSYVNECLKSDNAINSTCRMRRIIESKYENADLNMVMAKQCQHLNSAERYTLITL